MSTEAYEALRCKGHLLVGELGDLERRASIYHGMFKESGGRNVFPLIAAHGALWATGYFKLGKFGAWLLSLPYLASPARRRAKLAEADAFADSFREINRRVCAESYALFHYTRQYGADRFIRNVIGDAFAEALCDMHASTRMNTSYPPEKREHLFLAFFNWEQDNIVGPAVVQAFDAFHWETVKSLARKTRLDFRYFGRGFGVKFDDFSSKEERISRGLQVYRRAEQVGLDRAEAALAEYGACSAQFRTSASPCFSRIALN